MVTNFSGAESALVGLGVAVLFIIRQFRTRRVASLWMWLVPLVLAAIGISGLSQLNSVGWAVLALNLALGIGLGVVRGNSFRLWTNSQGQAVMRATNLTLVLWLVTIAIKIGLALLERQTGLTTATPGADIMLPAAATLAAQNLSVYLRSQTAALVTA
jgi:hypothetical protein